LSEVNEDFIIALQTSTDTTSIVAEANAIRSFLSDPEGNTPLFKDKIEAESYVPFTREK
jgi:hypothetical protein